MLARHVLQNYLKYQNPNNITQKDISMIQNRDYYVVTEINPGKSHDEYSLMPIYTQLPNLGIIVSRKNKKLPKDGFVITGQDFPEGSIVQLVKDKIQKPIYKESYEEFVVLSSEKVLSRVDDQFYTNVWMFGSKSGKQFSQIHESSPLFETIKRGDLVVADTADVDYPIIRNLTTESMISELVQRQYEY